MSARAPARAAGHGVDAEDVRAVRPGRGANCSSLGSSIDALLGGAVAVSALVAAVAAALSRREPDASGRDDVPGAPDDAERARARGDVWLRLPEGDSTLVRLASAAARHAAGDAVHRAEDLGAERRLEVHVAVTERCGVGCDGCYLDARPEGHEPSRSALEARLDAAAAEGAFVVALGGGEPTLRDDLGDLADAARARGLSPVVTTAGLGLGPKKLDRLARFAQVNVSLDGTDGVYRASRGVDGADEALATVRALTARGVRVGVNVVLTRATLAELETTLAAAHAAGAVEAQLLRYKPAGRAARLDYLARRLAPDDVAGLRARLARTRARLPGLALRVDCALVPFVLDDAEAALAERAGVLGCEAGRHLAARDALGRARPCSFHGSEEADPAAGGPSDPLARAATYPARAPEPCASCPLAAVCRGGCRVVAAFLGDAEGPDPECPRVRAHGAALAAAARAQGSA